jgi:hypothetical protein
MSKEIRDGMRTDSVLGYDDDASSSSADAEALELGVEVVVGHELCKKHVNYGLSIEEAGNI